MSKQMTKSQFRLPTKEEFVRLNMYFARWNVGKRCMEILNGDMEILSLPADGYQARVAVSRKGRHGYYWSSTECICDSKLSYSFCFHSRSKCVYDDHPNIQYSIRLVSDEPFEGGILFDNTWWKPENEPGYYSWHEAINKFNNQ